MESGIYTSVVSLNVLKKNEVKTCDEEIVKEKLHNAQEKTKIETNKQNRIKGFLFTILSAFLFCMNSTFSKMAFTLNAADNTFVSKIFNNYTYK